MKRLAALIAALLLGSAAGVAVTTTSASAAACAHGTGVTVVVEGQVGCDSNGGGNAASNFDDAGHALTSVSTQPGMVCRVDGAPASAGCVNAPPANKYWGLFWSDGKSGTWKYSSLGVTSLDVPKGGWVAFVFQNSNTKRYPSMKPVTASASAPKATPAPAAKPKPKPKTAQPQPTRTTAPATAGGKPEATSSAPTPSATPTPSSTAKTPKPKPSATSKATADTLQGQSAAEDEAEIANASKSSDDGGSGGLPYVAAAIGILLIAGMAATVWRRRAAGGPS